MSHTPGPWKAEFLDGVFQNAYDGEGAEVDAGARGVIAANGSMVAYTSRGWADKLSEAHSNIRLIAAAPDLLAACKRVLASTICNEESCVANGCPCNVVNNAVQKAEGK